MTQQQQSTQQKSKWKVSRAGTYQGKRVEIDQVVEMTDSQAEQANNQAQSSGQAAQFTKA